MDSTRPALRVIALDRRVAAAVGRHARLELVFEHRSSRTILTHAYAEPPLRIGRTFDVDGAAYCILVCAGPGVFAGDSLYQSVTVGPGARVLLASQSALQVHPAGATDPAIVHYDYRVAPGGELHCHWDPAIPFAGSRVVQRVNLRIAGDSRFYWSEALMSGRVGRGESWQFHSIDHELRLDVDDRLSYLERYRLLPADRPGQHPWRAGPGHYLGTTLMHSHAATSAQAERAQRELETIGGARAGIDLVEEHLIVGRLLADGGAEFERARTKLRAWALERVFLSPRLVARR